MDYSEILPGLFVGSFPQSKDDVERLHRAGVTAVLNLQTDDDMRHFNLDWNSLEAHYGARGMELRRVPVKDFDGADLKEKLSECVRVLSELREAGHRVFVHCTAGAGRSPSVVAAYLHWRQGLELDQAVELVKKIRPSSPNADAIRLASGDLPAKRDS